MCKCREGNWCRTWRETQGGKYPHSDHAPGCEDYKQEPFTRIAVDGTAMIVEPAEAAAILGNTEGYEVSMVMLTRDQFERMEEFSGF